MLRFCKHPHYLHTLQSNKGADSERHFYPIHALKYVQTVFDDLGLAQQVYKPIPEPALSSIKKYYEEYERKTQQRILPEQTVQPKPMNRQLQALQQNERSNLSNKSSSSSPSLILQKFAGSQSLTNKRFSNKQAGNIANVTTPKSTSSGRPSVRSIPTARVASTRLKALNASEIVESNVEISECSDDATEDMEILNNDVADEDEDQENGTLMEFFIAAVHSHPALWDEGIPHTVRTQPADEDWIAVLQHLTGTR